MPISFLPKVITKTVTDIRPDWLKSRNIRLLMLDFDNTIVPYTTNTPTEAVENWLKELLAADIQLCVVSNSKRDRVKIFCAKYGMDCITTQKSLSPREFGNALTATAFLLTRRHWWEIRSTPIPWVATATA